MCNTALFCVIGDGTIIVMIKDAETERQAEGSTCSGNTCFCLSPHQGHPFMLNRTFRLKEVRLPFLSPTLPPSSHLPLPPPLLLLLPPPFPYSPPPPPLPPPPSPHPLSPSPPSLPPALYVPLST